MVVRVSDTEPVAERVPVDVLEDVRVSVPLPVLVPLGVGLGSQYSANSTRCSAAAPPVAAVKPHWAKHGEVNPQPREAARLKPVRVWQPTTEPGVVALAKHVLAVCVSASYVKFTDTPPGLFHEMGASYPLSGTFPLSA